MAWLIRSEDRKLFKNCRRAWDFGARMRQDLEPIGAARPETFVAALREALAVYYFPGMWSWERSVVEPLAVAALRRSPGAAGDAAARGEGLLARYFDWARPLDRFTAIRVAADFEVNVPDPDHEMDGPVECDLAGVDGEPVRFKGQIDLLIQDEYGAFWLVEHSITENDRLSETELLLDEASAARCWAWERFFLGMVIRGTIFNQILLDPRAPEPFRRTVVLRERTELAARRRQMAQEVQDMLAPEVHVYPNPAPERCSVCPFARPCVAMITTGGTDPRLFVAGELRRRVAAVGEPRLGAETWPTNRALATGRLRGEGPIQ